VANIRRGLLRIALTALLVAVGVVVVSIPNIIRSRRLPPPDLNPFAPLVDSGTVPPDSLGLDSARVAAALGRVADPELGFSVAELGLVHRLEVDSARNVWVVLTLTTAECPFSRPIAEEALDTLKALPGARRIELLVDPSIPWDPARLTGEAKRRYESVFPSDSSDSR